MSTSPPVVLQDPAWFLLDPQGSTRPPTSCMSVAWWLCTHILCILRAFLSFDFLRLKAQPHNLLNCPSHQALPKIGRNRHPFRYLDPKIPTLRLKLPWNNSTVLREGQQLLGRTGRCFFLSERSLFPLIKNLVPWPKMKLEACLKHRTSTRGLGSISCKGWPLKKQK